MFVGKGFRNITNVMVHGQGRSQGFRQRVQRGYNLRLLRFIDGIAPTEGYRQHKQCCELGSESLG